MDDVLARRARLKRVTSLGQRTGYGLYVASLIGGVVGIRWGYTPLLSTLVAVALVVGSMLLLPTIVMGYGIKAAEREERQAAAAATASADDNADGGQPCAGTAPANADAPASAGEPPNSPPERARTE